MAGSEAEELQLRVFRRDPPLASTLPSICGPGSGRDGTES